MKSNKEGCRISVKTTTSKNTLFQNVNFIDTPGLHDMTYKYKFDIDAAIEYYGKYKL